jgi:hypothetical protein
MCEECRKAQAEYDKAEWDAWQEYTKAEQPFWLKYVQMRTEAWEEYERVWRMNHREGARE